MKNIFSSFIIGAALACTGLATSMVANASPTDAASASTTNAVTSELRPPRGHVRPPRTHRPGRQGWGTWSCEATDHRGARYRAFDRDEFRARREAMRACRIYSRACFVDRCFQR